MENFKSGVRHVKSQPVNSLFAVSNLIIIPNMLDFSAAFTTDDLSNVLNCPKHQFGIDGSLVQWFSFYLAHRWFVLDDKWKPLLPSPPKYLKVQY